MAVPTPKPSIDTCTVCGKLFPRTSMRLCTSCAVVDENRFNLVREYLVENDGAPIGEIARATGVSTSDVRAFCDGGRLVEITGGMDSCSCKGVGNRCRYCRAKLSGTFRSMQESMKRDHEERGESGRTSYVRRIRRFGE